MTRLAIPPRGDRDFNSALFREGLDRAGAILRSYRIAEVLGISDYHSHGMVPVGPTRVIFEQRVTGDNGEPKLVLTPLAVLDSLIAHQRQYNCNWNALDQESWLLARSEELGWSASMGHSFLSTCLEEDPTSHVRLNHLHHLTKKVFGRFLHLKTDRGPFHDFVPRE